MAAKLGSSGKPKKKPTVKKKPVKKIVVVETYAYACSKCDKAETDDFEKIKKHKCAK